MDTFKSFEPLLYSVNEHSFDNIALSLFRYQAEHNLVYKQWLHYLGVSPAHVKSVLDIPFMPISFFKSQTVKTGKWAPESEFRSSGTSKTTTSIHFVKDLEFYKAHSLRNFHYFFGAPHQYHFLALLPSYLERNDSSLVCMMDDLIQKSNSPHSRFYLNNLDQLIIDLESLRGDDRPVVLWGVTFALLELAERYAIDLSHCMVFETGGMKGMRKEIIRQELHAQLCTQLNVTNIYSEYGMTELFSQAYTRGESSFYTPPWMRIIGRDITDPGTKGIVGETSGINVIDLANWHSIAFIETEDIGRVYANGAFEVLGRLDNSDVRGCNLLMN